MTEHRQHQLDAAGRIAAAYLEKFPRKLRYGVTLTSTEDGSEETCYHSLSPEELETLRRCSDIAEDEGMRLMEALEDEGQVELVDKLLKHSSPFSLDLIESIDLEHPLKFTKFSIQSVNEDGTLGRQEKIGVELTDDEYKEILVELLYNSNHYSMNMLVYHKPALAQKIIKHLTYASMDFMFENWNPYIADMPEFKSACDSILNPFVDVLGIFSSDDANIKNFALMNEIIYEGNCHLYGRDDENDSYHVFMHFEGTQIKISQEGIYYPQMEYHDCDDFTVDGRDVMAKFNLAKPEDIYPFLKAKCGNNRDCFAMLKDELMK